VWQFNVQKVHMWAGFTFIGSQVSNAMFTLLLFTLFLCPIVTLLSWRVIWEAIGDFLAENVSLVITLLTTPLLNAVIKTTFKKRMYATFPRSKGAHTGKYIKDRFCWMFFDILQVFLTIIAGPVTAAVRFILVTVFSLFGIARMARSPFPAWVEFYLLLDSGSKSYQGILVQQHHMNNPVVRVAAWIMEQDAWRRQRDDERERFGLASRTKRRVSNRWNLWWFLLKFPSMRAHRCRPEDVDRMRELRAKKKKARQERKAKEAAEGKGDAKKGCCQRKRKKAADAAASTDSDEDTDEEDEAKLGPNGAGHRVGEGDIKNLTSSTLSSTVHSEREPRPDGTK